MGYFHVSEQAANRLPLGKLLATKIMTDMDGNDRPGVLLLWFDPYHDQRYSWFDRETGEYLGEGYLPQN